MFEPTKIFNELRSYAETAAGEMANNVACCPGLDDKWENEFKRLKNYVRDPIGALADRMFSDPEFVSDMVGDRLYDMCKGDKAKMNTVGEEMRQVGGLWASVADHLKLD